MLSYVLLFMLYVVLLCCVIFCVNMLAAALLQNAGTFGVNYSAILC